jgi:deoxyribodipyrimidine photo-lyase
MEENPNAPAIFVFDEPFLEANRISFARLQFMFEGALSALRDRAQKRVCVGVQAEEIAGYAREQGCTSVHVTQVYTPELEGTLDELEEMGFEIVVYAPDRLTSYSGEVKRFSKFWRSVEREVLG